MKRPVKVPLLYNRTGNCITSCPADIDSTTQQQPKSYSFTHRNQFPRPSFSQRAHLNGILHTPDDAVFVIITILFIFWSLVRLFCLELPYFILTGFRRSTKQHPVEWSWWASALFSILRCGCSDIDTMGQARFIGLLLNSFMPLQMLFLPKKIKITKGIKFKVKLDVLLRPERASLTEVRAQLLENYPNFSDDPMNPSESYLKSMHPRGPNAPLANIPEEVGPLDTDGTYTLTGEWIEALEDSSKSSNKPRSNTVVLYFHGGAHIICSSKTHRHTLARLAMEIGPGTRIFSVDYRLAPENPFPASVHDAFAAFLYLTEPNHTALVLDDGDNSAATVHQLPIDPRNIVVAGDSAGGNIAAAFMLYMNKYVQPSTEPKFILPHAALLLSPWMDITSSLPAGKSFDWHCFCPGPIGTSPFDKKAFIEYKKQNYACIYVCGDKNLVPNARNALGKDRYWQWYTHLAQHPLISIAFANEGSLGGFTNTLFVR
ncbi:alpha/beta hydrolase fold-domain-containing protein [Lobosporangium transversale]|uniref:Alpha/beta hydrolase fold-domain-containing protein n=1 Tax=Lobosporangium transversale TaxID=64571 RepID=A0A1Y2GEK2_9FUNG|nr:alpha/beta hydrolase fold-domain-containing protein [Lobosporangium transversale]ORZ08587.1 alpha/beta hydrolase fold-domain-containing protein [Lobosporangium transversale]|eukprot:XP_021878515.1 alpha/beta hydrolase fold-domain-containing protein [Lobosporangium transversale]